MKLVVTGASGYAGTELIRQSLQLPQVTSVVAVARKSVPAPAGSDPTRFRSIVVKDYGDYQIPTVGITPLDYGKLETKQARKICIDDTLVGLETMVKLSIEKPFRFVYMSGADAERDQSKKPPFLPDYFLMRGEVKNRIFKFAEQHPDAVRPFIARPGLITNDTTDTEAVMARLGKEVTTIRLEMVATALLQQALHGFEKQTLWTDDLRQLAESK